MFSKGFREFSRIDADYDMDTLRDRDDFKSLVKEYKAIFDEGRQNYTKSCDDNTM